MNIYIPLSYHLTDYSLTAKGNCIFLQYNNQADTTLIK